MQRPGRTPRTIHRRSLLAGAGAGLAWGAFERAEAAAQERVGHDAPVPRKDAIKITKLETSPSSPAGSS